MERVGRTGGIVGKEGTRTLLYVRNFIFWFICTVRLFYKLHREAGVTMAIQFPYEQLPRHQGWQFIYFNLTD